MKYVKTLEQQQKSTVTILDLNAENGNMFSELPDLSEYINLEYLYFDNHLKLKELPELPKKLKTLSCRNNGLYHLPELPESLIILSCGENELRELPKLPKKLEHF